MFAHSFLLLEELLHLLLFTLQLQLHLLAARQEALMVLQSRDKRTAGVESSKEAVKDSCNSFN